MSKKSAHLRAAFRLTAFLPRDHQKSPMWQITNRSMTVLDCQARYHFEMLFPLLAGAPNDSHLHWSCHSFDHLLSRVTPIYRMRGRKSTAFSDRADDADERRIRDWGQ